MPLIKVETIADAPKDAVWAVLADFGNVHEYTSQVKTTLITTEEAMGVGVLRQCQLAPMGATTERTLEFVPGERLVVALYDVKGLPVKVLRSTFTLEAIDEDHTRLSFEADARPRAVSSRASSTDAWRVVCRRGRSR